MSKDRDPIVLVTGGAGYIGSHSVLLLLEQDRQVVVVDNCSNAYVNREFDDNGNQTDSLPESLRRVEILTGKQLVAFYAIDLVDSRLNDVFSKHHIGAVIHFASLKSTLESITKPLEYYTNNIVGTLNLLNTMTLHNCKRLIFSSSATVYGLPQYLPVDEQHQTGQNILNPYGRTKFMIEQILQDLYFSSLKTEQTATRNGWNIVSLRYFNPVGAHPSGYIGEHTQDVPNNLMPYVAQVSVGKRDRLFVFGDDFDTPDGTGVRDFIHIMDLASGHTHALDQLIRLPDNQSSLKVYNLGTGIGYSVLEVIRTFEQVNKVKVPFEITRRRQGDAGSVYADATLANKELGWSARYTLAEMCRDIYKWQRTNPDGFRKSVEGQNDKTTPIREESLRPTSS